VNRHLFNADDHPVPITLPPNPWWLRQDRRGIARLAVVGVSKKIVDELRARTAMIWDVDVDGVIWEDGQAKPASSNVGDFAPLSFKELAAKKALTGGPITAAALVNAGGRGFGQCRRHGPGLLDPVL
jgi:hypothetical protein